MFGISAVRSTKPIHHCRRRHEAPRPTSGRGYPIALDHLPVAASLLELDVLHRHLELLIAEL